jgi:D-alanyl-D-alanine carboxypeptidase
LAKGVSIALASALALACGTLPAGAGTALVFDTEDGHVLYAEEPDAPWYPASLTKMMTAYLAFIAVRDSRATYETKIFISPHATNSRRRLGLRSARTCAGDALQALIMRSANDIAVAIAETLGRRVSFVEITRRQPARHGALAFHQPERSARRAAGDDRPRHGAARAGVAA